jgi:FMN hydrolase / 5-amino-6-(5-phospho-D-ribitylamino)uracil phosphatase
MPFTLRAVSLDLDNTLWDTPPVLERAEVALSAWLERQAPRMAAAFDRAEQRRVRVALAVAEPGRAHDLSWLRRESLRRAAAAAGYADEVAERAFAEFLRERNVIELYADAEAALERMARRVPLYALTNGNACVTRVGIGRFFQSAIDAAGAGAAKPDARMFQRLAELAALPPAAMLHVGDDALADVHGGRAAGFRTVWVNRHRASWPSELPRADHEVADLTTLAALVESLS